ncbi:hypothetical protein Tco_0591229 [Tanacetum coccineum]
MTPIHEYLVSGLSSKDPKESRKIKVKKPQYKLIRGNMYQRSFYTLWLRYVASPQTDDIVKEIWSAMNNQLEGREAFSRRTLPRNSQKETPFSLTYDSEAIIPISETNVTKDDRGRIKEVDKRRGSKEIASIKEAYYQSKLCRHHSERSSHSIYNVGDFVLLSQNNTGSTQVWQGPHMVSEVQGRGLYKIVYESDHLLTQIAKGMSLHKFYM